MTRGPKLSAMFVGFSSQNETAACCDVYDELSLLLIVVDVNPLWWGRKAQEEPEFSLSKCIDAIMVLGNSHLVMNRNNRLAVIASHCQESHFLYPSKHWKGGDFASDENSAGSRDGKFELLTVANDLIVQEIKHLTARSSSSCWFEQKYKHLLIKNGRTGTTGHQPHPSKLRPACAAVKEADCPDLMKTLLDQFLGVLIDACVLDAESGLLQQWVFLPDPDQRSQLVLPPPVHVDYRAACFCHRNLIEIGYVCSVCLSSYATCVCPVMAAFFYASQSNWTVPLYVTVYPRVVPTICVGHPPDAVLATVLGALITRLHMLFQYFMKSPDKRPDIRKTSKASRKQKKILRYVEEGSLLKLKSYLRKHKHVDLNFSTGRKGRSLLHLACSLGDDAVLMLLIKRGANPLSRDRRGDTPLHVAANRALRHGKRDYDDFVVPLKKICPAAMETPNLAGVTPQDILQWMQPEEVSDFSQDYPEPETFDQWANRIRQEYGHKRAESKKSTWQSGSGKQAGSSKMDTDAEMQSQRAFQAKLEADHMAYLALATRKETELLQSRKERYQEKCAASFQADTNSMLGYTDIPWPSPRGSVQEMVNVIIYGVNQEDKAAFRKFLRQQQALWHPDKFIQRCGSRLKEEERTQILSTVTALSQELNRLAESSK
ncbi:TF2H3 factor, partial [Polypterus senegalus]